MRSLYEPTTILMAAVSGLQLFGGMMNANTARDNASAQVQYLQAESTVEDVQGRRDQADLRTKFDQAQGRALALMAANGGGTTYGSNLSVLDANAYAYGATGSRLDVDSKNKKSTLAMRADNVLALGEAQADAAMIGGVGSAANTIAQYSLLKPTPATKKP